MLRTASIRSARCSTGPKSRCGTTSRLARFRTTCFTIAPSRASAARPAPAPSSRVRISAPAAGGGRTRTHASADCSPGYVTPSARLEPAGEARMDYLPIFIQLRGSPAVVVGGGNVALRKVDLLLKGGRARHRDRAEAARGASGVGSRGQLDYVALEFHPHHLDGTSLVIAATDSREVNAAVSAAAKARRLPINVVDDPELSTFIFPAIIDRSPVVVAVGSSGNSPVLARRVRQQIEALLPARLGALARFVGDRRSEVKRALAPEQRRPFWERIIGGIVGSRVLAGDEATRASVPERAGGLAQRSTTPRRRVEAGRPRRRGLSDRRRPRRSGPAHAARRSAAAAGRRGAVRPPGLRTPCSIARAAMRERVFVGKETGGDHHVTQARIHELLVQLREARAARVRASRAATRSSSAAVAKRSKRCGRTACRMSVVPGITAALGAAASASIPLTHRRSRAERDVRGRPRAR